MDQNQVTEDIRALKARNARVEAEKAWETSLVRVLSITLTTYVVAAAALVSIGNDTPFLNASIPAMGYFLSTLSLPFLKRRWIEKHLNKHAG